VSVEEWCDHIGALTGLTPKFHYTDDTLRSLPLDPGRMHELAGQTAVPWRDGIRRMLEARAPELLVR
jgi:hypothetical protein